MTLHGQHLVADERTGNPTAFRALNPATDQTLEPAFAEAGQADVDAALAAAKQAHATMLTRSRQDRAALLRAMATAIEELGAPLLERAHQETGLPLGRLTGERGRTTAQLRITIRSSVTLLHRCSNACPRLPKSSCSIRLFFRRFP